MAFTYSGDPASSSRDAVRFLIGDTDSTDAQLQDTEIAYLLTQDPTPAKAAANAARAIAAKYGRLVDFAVGDLRYSYAQRQKAYLDLAAQLEAQAAVSGSIQFKATGISRADKEAAREMEDRVKPAFTRETMDNPRAGEAFDQEPDDDDL